MIRVVLLSNKPIVFTGLLSVLKTQADIRVVGIAKTANDMFQLVESQQPDVLVMDAMLSEGNFLNVVRDVLVKPNSPDILIFSLNGGADVIRKAFEAGVFGYLLYCDDFTLVVEAVRAITAGDRWTSPEVERRLTRALLASASSTADSAPTAPSGYASLSEREKEVFALLVRGKQDKEIAMTLIVSKNTVRTHLSNIYTKLGVKNRSEAIAWAAQNLPRDDELM